MAIQPPQRFELDDLTHVEREARTIYAPGATPGDVLVVQSDHSLIAAPGGGSQPDGILTSKDFSFVETAGAGVYTATLPVPAGTLLIDIGLSYGANWTADTALFDAATGATTYFSGVELTTTNPGVWDSAQVDENGSGPFLAPEFSPATEAPTDDTLTMTVTTTGAGGTTGRLLVKAMYFTPVTAVAAVKS